MTPTVGRRPILAICLCRDSHIFHLEEGPECAWGRGLRPWKRQACLSSTTSRRWPNAPASWRAIRISAPGLAPNRIRAWQYSVPSRELKRFHSAYDCGGSRHSPDAAQRRHHLFQGADARELVGHRRNSGLALALPAEQENVTRSALWIGFVICASRRAGVSAWRDRSIILRRSPSSRPWAATSSVAPPRRKKPQAHVGPAAARPIPAIPQGTSR